MQTTIGKVILAGAGPGDPELVTLKALNYLKKADVILTDRLVSPVLIDEYASKDALIIYVGKQCSKGIHTPQKDINDLMMEFAMQGKLVLRLKGGDASLFSNILDELETLKKNHVPYEIIPGISAAFGAAAYTGIPLTARNHSKGVRMLTLCDLKSIEDKQWKDWAKTSDTLVFYMSGQRLQTLADQLILNGIDTEKGLAVIQQATTPDQKTQVFTFENIVENHLPTFDFVPTLIIVGHVVNLHQSFAWLDEQPTSNSYFDNIKQQFLMLANEKLNLVKSLVKELSRDEIIWTNGYLAGLVANQTQDEPKVQKVLTTIKPTIIYGTETGNAKKLANQLLGIFKKNKIQAKAVDAFQYPLEKIEKEEFLILIFSTQGDGDLPQNAQKFYDNLSNSDLKLNQTKFAVFGLGDTSYPFFCKSGEEIDELFGKLGAQRVFDLVKVDLDYQEIAENWFAEILKTIQSEGNSTTAQPQKLQSSSTQKKSYEGIVKHKVILNDRGSNKETYHIEISVDEQVDYEPGDALGVYPKNNQTEILAIAKLFNEENRAKELEEKNIRALSKKSIDQFATILNVEILETKIDLIDLLTKYYSSESTIKFDDILNLLHPIAPRLYSISSSNEAHDNEIHLTVSLNTFSVSDQQKTGLCSQFLADFEQDKSIEFYIHKNKNFKLPDENQSVIMIGPGTGIAPFRSFLTHRDAIGAEGKNWLFFGEQHFVSDFYYQTEIQEWLSTGVLSKLDTAFSRDQKHKIYVQDRVKEHGKELYNWLNDGAYLYVCGQKDGMSTDVESALIELIAKESNQDEVSAKNFLEQLEEEGRYQKDVY